MDWNSPLSEVSEHIRFIRSVQWEKTDLGHPSKWPRQLHEMVDFVLASPSPATVMWGNRVTMLYNEAFVVFAGTKHPNLMGGTPIVEYAEVWDEMFAPIIAKGRDFGQATRHKDVPLLLHRHGFIEECFVTYTFIPIFASGETKRVVGFIHTADETTAEVLSDRRTKTLLSLAESSSSSRTVPDYWEAVLQAFKANSADAPYALAYTFREHDHDHVSSSNGSSTGSVSSSGERVPRSCTLAGVVGKSISTVPLNLNVLDSHDPFTQSVTSAITHGSVAVLDESQLPDWLQPSSPSDPKNENTCRAVVIPVRPTKKEDLSGMNSIGIIVLGLNPRRPYDDHYEKFVHLWKTTLSTAAASVLLLEQETMRKQQLAEQLVVSAKHVQDTTTKLSRFAEMSKVAMWVMSPTGELIFNNKAWQEQIPQLNDDAGLISWAPSVVEECHSLLRKYWTRLIEDKVSVTFELRLKALWQPPGERRYPAKDNIWILVTAVPELDERNEIRIWGCNTEISHQKWAESLKQQRLDDLLETKRQSENFIDMTSHEMRNPLSAILQSAEVITTTIQEAEDGNVDLEVVAESAQTIILCAQHQKRIVDDILTLSKLDSSLLKVSLEEVDPISTCRHAIKLHHQEIAAAKIETELYARNSYYSLNIDHVQLDPSRLLQVLINLLTNAIKFTQFQEQRKITIYIDASETDPAIKSTNVKYLAPNPNRKINDHGDSPSGEEQVYIEIEVKDTGCGLSPEEMERLFHRFAQANPKTYSRYGGSGLGLFICKELTELQGGRIGVNSVQGQGSSFFFYAQAQRVPNTSKRQNGNPEDGRRNLLIKEESRKRSADAQASRKSQTDSDIAPINKTQHSPSQNPVIGSAHSPDTLHVLVVEDNLINQKVVATQLRRAGCIVHVANHGADALVFLKTTTFGKDCGPKATPLSIVLLDLEMPVMDGLTCIRQIRNWQKTGEFTRPVPVIAVTANARQEQVENAKKQGMDDVVTKPFRVPDLIPQMRALIERTST